MKSGGCPVSPVRKADEDVREDVLAATGNPWHKIFGYPLLVPSPFLAAFPALKAILCHMKDRQTVSSVLICCKPNEGVGVPPPASFPRSPLYGGVQDPAMPKEPVLCERDLPAVIDTGSDRPQVSAEEHGS